MTLIGYFSVIVHPKCFIPYIMLYFFLVWCSIVFLLLFSCLLVFFITGWALKTKTSFSRNSAVFLLGKCYHFKADGNRNDTHARTHTNLLDR